MVIAAIDATVRNGATADDDFRTLVSLVSGGREPSSSWTDAVPEILIRGWAGNEQLRDMCLEAAARQWEHGDGIKKSVATALLTAAFPGDDKVAAWIAAELDQAPHPFLMAGRPPTWQNIAVNFRDHPVVVEAAVRWIPGQRFGDSEVSLLALVTRTDRRGTCSSAVCGARRSRTGRPRACSKAGACQDAAVAEACAVSLTAVPRHRRRGSPT